MVMARGRAAPMSRGRLSGMNRDFVEMALAQAERHVARGQVILARQRAMITAWERSGRNAALCKEFLSVFEDSQRCASRRTPAAISPASSKSSIFVRNWATVLSPMCAPRPRQSMSDATAGGTWCIDMPTPSRRRGRPNRCWRAEARHRAEPRGHVRLGSFRPVVYPLAKSRASLRTRPLLKYATSLHFSRNGFRESLLGYLGIHRI